MTPVRSRQRTLIIALASSLAILVLEMIGGVWSNSLSLLSDAGHVFVDVLAIGLALLALRLTLRPVSAKRTYGWLRAEVLASLLNGVLLMLIAMSIFYTGLQRLYQPTELLPAVALIFGVIGLAANILAAVLLKRERAKGENLNIKAAFWHVLSDTLSSVGVVASALIIWFTGWTQIDALVSMLIALFIIRGAVSLINESVGILLEATPKDVDVEALKRDLLKIPGVKKVHDVHVWTVTSGRYAMSGHVMTGSKTIQQNDALYEKIDVLLRHTYHVDHATIQFESSLCYGKECSIPQHI
ncbi:MAG: cation diffusion facilitator family transporter [Patescibacteria group bacterium]